MDDLRRKTLAGLFWSLTERLGVRVAQFTVTVFLARLLAPEQFGLIGMLSLFITLGQTFIDSGFGAALIQKKDATYLDECSIFYFNICVGALFYLLLCLAAPAVAAFFRQPLLTPLTRFLMLGVLIDSFGLIQTARLTRGLEFGTLMRANVLAVVASGGIGVAMACLGFGVWSLASQSISNSLIRTATLWWVCTWRPS
jgi:O-antigen/teichoic acid export membrane protein